MPNTRLLTLMSGVVAGRVGMRLSHVTSPTNPALVPAAGATVRIYRLGAASAEQVELFEGMTVQIAVSDAGQVQVGDTLIPSVAIDSESDWLYVSAIATNRTWIEVQYAGTHMVVPAGTRMTPANAPPPMNKGYLGGPVVTSVTSDDRGDCEFYTLPHEFDYTIHYPPASGWANELLTYLVPGGWTPAGLLDAGDFLSLQAAIDALPPEGGTVFVPAGTWPQTAPLLFPADRAVRLAGAGRSSTILHWAADPTGSGSTQSDGLVRVRGDNQVIEGLTVRGPGSATRLGPGRGIVVGRRAGEAATTHPLDGFQLRDCDVRESQSWALYVYGKDTATDPYVDPNSDMSISIVCGVRDCTFAFNRADGAIRLGSGTVDWGLERVSVGAGMGIQLHAISTTLLRCEGCDFDEPADDLSGKVLLESCAEVTFDGCDFENPISTLTSPYFITITGNNSNAISILNSNFMRAPAASVPSASKKDLPTRLVNADGNFSVHGLRVENLVLYMHLGAGVVSLAADDILVPNLLSEVIIEGCVRGDDTAYSELRVSSSARRTARLGPRRIRVPTVLGAELQTMTPAAADVVEGDMVYNADDGRLYVYAKLNGSAGWRAVTVS